MVTHTTTSVNTATSEYAQTLGNGLRVLEYLREQPAGMGVNGVAAGLGLHRTVVYRLLGTLRAHGLLAQDGAGRYRLGAGLLEIASGVRTDLRATAEPRLAALADEVAATAFLTLAEASDAVSACVRAPRSAQLHVGYRVGLRHSLTVSAAGLAILAALPARHGERPAIARARRLGYAVTANELEPGAWGLAVALPIEVVPEGASVGVVAMTELDEHAVADAVRRAAADIAAHAC